MNMKFLYRVKVKIKSGELGLEEINNNLKKMGAGFTLKQYTDDFIDFANLSITVKLDKDGKPNMPADWQDTYLNVIKNTCERHHLILGDMYLELIDKYETEEEEV